MEPIDVSKALRQRFGRPVRNREQQRAHEREVLRGAGPKPAGYVKNEAVRKANKRAAKSRRKNRA